MRESGCNGHGNHCDYEGGVQRPPQSRQQNARVSHVASLSRSAPLVRAAQGPVATFCAPPWMEVTWFWWNRRRETEPRSSIRLSPAEMSPVSDCDEFFCIGLDAHRAPRRFCRLGG